MFHSPRTRPAMQNILPPTFDPDFHDEKWVRRMRYSRLGNTDMVVSNYGHGGAAFTDMYTSVSSDASKDILLTGLKRGVNFIDTSPWYGQGKSEENIGKALEGVDRKTYYLATKVGRYNLDAETMFDFSRAKIVKSFEQSLKLLKTDYVDLIQVHDVEFCGSLKQIVEHTLPALKEIKESGRARYVGITGYNLGVLRRIVSLSPPGSVDVVLSYARFTLFNRDLADSGQFFRDRGVGLISASPVGMGLLSGGEPPKWHPAPDATREVVVRAAEFAKERGYKLPHLAMKLCLHQPDLFSVCLGSSTSLDELESNLESAAETPTDDERAVMTELEERFFRWMNVTQWENLEVVEYWKKMKEGGHKQNMDV